MSPRECVNARVEGASGVVCGWVDGMQGLMGATQCVRHDAWP